MQRGIVVLTKAELQAIVNEIDLSHYEGTPFRAKVEAGLLTKDMTSNISLEVSEEEVEIMLDAIVIPTSGEDPIVTSARSKLQQRMASFR